MEVEHMPRRWHILVIITVVLLAFGLLAAAKLTATPKYDRVKVGMTRDDVEVILGQPRGGVGGAWYMDYVWDADEGGIAVRMEPTETGFRATEKSINRRAPLERLALLAIR